VRVGPGTALLLASCMLAVASARGDRARLEPVPFPELSKLEPAVAAQLRGLDANLGQTLEASATSARVLADVFGELGQVFHAYELWTSAAASYRNAKRLAPDDFRWVHLLADVETRRGDLAAARQWHEAALAIRPGDVPSLVGLGETCLGLNRIDESEHALLEAVRIEPNSAAAHAGLARAALVRRNFSSAREELLEALRLAPDANRLHYELAMAYRGLGDRTEAARHLALSGTVGVKVRDPLLEGVSARRQGERVHLVRGRLAFVNGRMREAAEEYAAAVEAEPHSIAGLVGLGSALGMLGETDRALETFRRAITLAPDTVSAHFNIGRILEARGETEAALREFETVIRLAPDDAEAVRARGNLLARRGRPPAQP
jgi:tetratricopeptide (TPR) repeat protein